MAEAVTARQDASTHHAHPIHHPTPQAGLQLGGLMLGIAVFLAVKEAFELYLAYRQLRRVQKVKTPPKELADIITEEELGKANAYAEERLKFGMIRSVWGTLLLVAELYYGIWPWLWEVALKAGNAASGGRVNENGKIHSLIFFLMQSQLSKIIDLPWDLYHTFVIEERHGFNKQTIGLYFMDMAKGLVLEVIFSTLIISGVIAVVEYTGDKFYVYLTILALVLNFVMMWIIPNFIQPWFNKFTPLTEGPIRAGIENLAQRVKFPLQKIFVMDAGKRSGHSNAYFYGFWKHQRIVLFDTMLNDFKDPEQIYAVLAHELGHWHHGHTFQGMALGLIESFAAIYTFKHVNQSDIYELFGFSVGSRRPIMIGMFLFFELVWAPVGTVVGFLTNLTTRHWEKQADAYSADLGFAEPLKSGLVLLSGHNKSTVDPDWLYSSYHHSHPPLMHRLRAINDHVRETSGKQIQETKKAQ